MLARLLTASLLALGLGVAALELSATPTAPSRASWGAEAASLFTDAGGPGLPIGAETDTDDVAALPRFTQ